MLDINLIRADFAAYLAAHASTRHSLDAALMHVVQRAYRQGMTDDMGAERAACVALCQEVVEFPPGHDGGWEGYGPVRRSRNGHELARILLERA